MLVQASQLHREYIENLNMTKEDRSCESRTDYSKIIIESLEKNSNLVERRNQLWNESSSDDSSELSYDGGRVVIVPEYSLLLDYVVHESPKKLEKSYLSSAIGTVVACLDYLLTGSFYENSAYYYVGQKYKH